LERSGRVPLNLLAEVCLHSEADIVMLAEASRSEAETVEELNAADQRFTLTINRSEQIQFFIGSSVRRFESLYDGTGVAVRRVEPVLGSSLSLIATHLPSKLHVSDLDQALLATRIAGLVRETETREGHERSVVIGDLNMNPFDAGVAASEGLHAVSTRSIAAEGSRVVRGQSRPFLYNPMWSLLGDTSPGPPGTYFYRDSAPTTYFWHSFDQVLLRPDLAAGFRAGDVQVITATKSSKLLSTSGRPVPSDHLPLLATLRIQEGDSFGQELVG
jgi:endonuclease/exonuclease/phosphatase family metal-dependent hydrolase